jgi:hypothetical protein
MTGRARNSVGRTNSFRRGALNIQFNAADLDGQALGQAFLNWVIEDPSVKAAGKRLCVKCPIFDPLFKNGQFPGETRRGRTFRNHNLPTHANVGYSELKGHWRGLPRGVPSDPRRASTVPTADNPPNRIVWDHKWPVVFNAEELVQALSSEDDTNTGYWRHPFKHLIRDAVCVLADSHQRFFDQLRRGEIVAEGTFKNTGQESPIPDKQWSREDRWLDVQNSDLFDKKGEVGNVMWESVKLRLSHQEAIAGTSSTASTTGQPTGASPPALSEAGDRPALNAPFGKRGPRTRVALRIEEAMKRDINEGRQTPESLAKMLEKRMEATYRASRDTCRKARKKVLSEILPDK